MGAATEREHTGSPVIAAAIGVVGLAMAVWLFVLTMPYPDGITVEGRVVTTEQVGERRLVFHTSEVEFVDQLTGRTHIATSEVGSFFAPEAGDLRDVSYRADAPEEGRVLEGRVFAWLFGAMSLLFLVPSVQVLARRRAAPPIT